jgi:hypothetical protein
MKICPFCANEVQDAAIKCQHCHERLDTGGTENAPTALSPAAAAAPLPPKSSAPPQATVKASPPKARRARHPLLSALIAGGVFYFLAMTAIWLLGGNVIGGAVNLVCAVPFVLLAPLAWWLGDVFRNFAMPSWYFGAGAIDLAKQRLFWMVGPQSVGVLVVFIAFAIVGGQAEILGARMGSQPAAAKPAEATNAAAASVNSMTSGPSAPSNAAPAAPDSPDPNEATSRFSADGRSAGSIADLPAAEAPAFEAQRVEVYAGPIIQPNFSSVSPDLAGEVPALKAAAQAGPNFAGAYALTTISCGDGCVTAIAMDLTNGDSIGLPRGGPGQLHLALEYVKDSSFIRMRWAAQTDATGQVTSCAYEDYVLTDNGFQSQAQHSEPGPCPS